jgi:acetyl esterase/lipase
MSLFLILKCKYLEMDPGFSNKSVSPSSEWVKVAGNQRVLDEKARKLYSLPLHEFRKEPYRAAPLSPDAPIPGRDLSISQREVRVRDGSTIIVRIYQPLKLSQNHLLFFNIHGGGQNIRDGTPCCC